MSRIHTTAAKFLQMTIIVLLHSLLFFIACVVDDYGVVACNYKLTLFKDCFDIAPFSH